MRLLVEPSFKDSNIFNINKAVILSLVDYSVQGFCYFTIDEIIDIKNKYKDIEIFVSLNKNFLNHEVEGLKEVLIKLNNMDIEKLAQAWKKNIIQSSNIYVYKEKNEILRENHENGNLPYDLNILYKFVKRMI
mgnify:CR=1 FL=1